MVFSTTSLLKSVPCPEGESCRLVSCIFAHDLRPQLSAPSSTTEGRGTAIGESAGPPTKRRRIALDKVEDEPPNSTDSIRDRATEGRSQKTLPTRAIPDQAKAGPASLTRSVSPPAKLNGKPAPPSKNTTANPLTTPLVSAVQPKAAEQTISLNPRLIANDPAGHAKRSQLLKLLHGEMTRLNKALLSHNNFIAIKKELLMSEDEIVQLAMEEEENLAATKGTVYGNVIKNRIGVYKKMTTDGWIEQLRMTPLFQRKQGPPPKKRTGQPDQPKPIVTEMTAEEEVAVLSELVVKDQATLAEFDYIPTPPTTEQANEAAAAVEASRNYEICDRCTARFQVFPNRNAEGQVASNGPCKHHPLRKIYPQKTKADTGPKHPYHPCCNSEVGSVGCTSTEYHVFKAATPARLAAVLPFIATPENLSPTKGSDGREVSAVAFDCEMGYTTLGMEVIRVTAVSWPDGGQLLDVLVRPLGIILDLNSRFSGVWPEDIAKGVPITSTTPPSIQPNATSESPSPPLPIAKNPQDARALLCSYLTPTTPLIGHAIENDLNVVRLCHPTIIDTVLAFPHPRGLPLRFGLRMLSSRHLGRAIQQGGERGHDSLEDARATGDLVRVKVGLTWKKLRATGWKLVDRPTGGGKQLVPPPPVKGGTSGAKDGDGGVPGDAVELVNREVPRKRKRDPDVDPDAVKDNDEADGQETGQGPKALL